MTVNKLREIHDFIISGGRAASIPGLLPEAEARVTEMVNGVLVSKPLKKVTEIRSKEPEIEPEVIDLQEYANEKQQYQQQSKGAASAVDGGINNKVKEIYDFLVFNGRLF